MATQAGNAAVGTSTGWRDRFSKGKVTLDAGFIRARARGAFASVSGKLQAAVDEASHLLRLADSWPERIRIAGLIAKIHSARALPWNTYAWDARIRLRGSNYTVGLRTSEIYVLEEVFGYRMYEQVEDYVPKPGWVVFDVGANVGIVSMLKARQHAEVYAFEPNPDCYRRLLRNIVGNRLEDRIHPFNVALRDTVAAGVMSVHKGGTTGGTVLRFGEPGVGAGPRVMITTLDQIVAALGISHIDLLKIDVEGAEVSVLNGAARTLDLTQRLILEYHSRDLLRRAEEILSEHGFVRERRVEYLPEDRASEQDEVGLIYASRVARHAAAAC